jgi:hypothetical protein
MKGFYFIDSNEPIIKYVPYGCHYSDIYGNVQLDWNERKKIPARKSRICHLPVVVLLT